MEDCCARKCKRSVREEDEVSIAASGSLKRMRTRNSGEVLLLSVNCELQNRSFPVNEGSVEDPCGFYASDSGVSFCSDRHSLTSSRSSSSAGMGSCEVVNDRSSESLNLEAKSSETEISTCVTSKLSVTETSPASDSDGMESHPKKKHSTSHRKKPPAAETRKVSAAEIEDFFSTSEKHNRQRLAEKYNFDVAKEVPLEGRYQWVRWKPSETARD